MRFDSVYRMRNLNDSLIDSIVSIMPERMSTTFCRTVQLATSTSKVHDKSCNSLHLASPRYCTTSVPSACCRITPRSVMNLRNSNSTRVTCMSIATSPIYHTHHSHSWDLNHQDPRKPLPRCWYRKQSLVELRQPSTAQDRSQPIS